MGSGAAVQELEALMKIAIVQCGPEDAGKTTTSRMFYEMLVERHPDAEVSYLLDAIITAARTRGGTLDAVRELEAQGYDLTERPRRREDGPDGQRRANRAEARWMLEQVEGLVLATVP
jgi:hypothetical protein